MCISACVCCVWNLVLCFLLSLFLLLFLSLSLSLCVCVCVCADRKATLCTQQQTNPSSSSSFSSCVHTHALPCVVLSTDGPDHSASVGPSACFLSLFCLLLIIFCFSASYIPTTQIQTRISRFWFASARPTRPSSVHDSSVRIVFNCNR